MADPAAELGEKREADAGEEESAKRQMTQPSDPLGSPAAKEAEPVEAAASPPGQPIAAPLPDGWDEFSSKRTGKPYWYNAASRETTWVRPKVGQETPQAAVAAATPAFAGYSAYPGGPAVNYPHRPGAEKCQHFMSHGRCKFGETCRYDHPPGTTPTHGVSENGGLTTENDRVLPGNQAMTGGLPVIAGVADCPFFMKTGMCKYGAKCKYNHPLEKQVGTSESTVKMPVSNKPPEMRSMMPAGAGAPQVALRPGSVVGPWEVHQNEMGQLYYFNVLSQQSTWQTPPELMTPSYGYAQPMGMPFNPAYAAYGMPAMGGYGAPGGYPQGAAAGYPQAVASGGPGGLKPGMPDCTFYIKMGKCKYGDACKFNHPIDGRPSGTTFVGLGNIEGNYPVRPGVPNCGFYMRTGECKYGPECKYNHPSKEEREAIRIAEGNPPFGGSSSSAPHAGQTASAYLAPTGYSYA